jgi:PAS domain S-box-containing protein
MKPSATTNEGSAQARPGGGAQPSHSSRTISKKTLERDQLLLSTALNQIPESVYITDTKGRFIRVNEAMAKRFGSAEPEAMLGKTVFDFLPSERAEAIIEEERIVLRTGRPIVGRVERVTLEGRANRWTSTNKLAIRNRDGRIIGLVGIIGDITEQKLVEQTLSEQAMVLNKTPAAILLLDSTNRIRYWSKGAEVIYGWGASEVTGKQVEEVLMRSVVSPQLHQAMQAIQEHGEWVGELQAVTKAGQSVIVESHCCRIHDTENNVDSILVINTDITEKKGLEIQMFRSQRLESIGRLAGGIAHDLNNVLTPLLIAVQLLKDKLPDDDTQKLLVSLDTNVQRGAQLLKQLLVYSRGTTGEHRQVQFDQIAREIGLMIQETFPKSITIEICNPVGLWHVNGDLTQLCQVLLNLCVNARDAMPNGGKLSIRLTNVTLDQTHVRLSAGARYGPYVMLKVSDTGVGIPKEIQAQIFEPFFSTKPAAKGTGLGLSICSNIVKGHGGFINVSSKQGEGASFMVYLPAERMLPTDDDPVSQPQPLPRGNGELVLAIDDEETIREAAKEILESEGYRVITAPNGAEGVRLYNQHRFEVAVVFIDMDMPVMDGASAIATLKSINPDLKIIGVSGLCSGDTESSARQAGAQCFIPKPYSAELLAQTLHAILHPEP